MQEEMSVDAMRDDFAEAKASTGPHTTSSPIASSIDHQNASQNASSDLASIPGSGDLDGGTGQYGLRERKSVLYHPLPTS
jgi:hypothetical protein